MIKKLVVLTLWLCVLMSTGGVQSFADERPSDGANSTASVSFMPNPEWPLHPDGSDEPNGTDQPGSTDNVRPTEKLPQTGEKKLSVIYGFIIIILIILIWYFRRKLLENKKNTNKMEEQ